MKIHLLVFECSGLKLLQDTSTVTSLALPVLSKTLYVHCCYRILSDMGAGAGCLLLFFLYQLPTSDIKI
jgi:hypothetical protein